MSFRSCSGSSGTTLVLRGMVCKDCNGTFGKETETVLGRGSFEGCVRYNEGVKGTNPAPHSALYALGSRRASGGTAEGGETWS